MGRTSRKGILPHDPAALMSDSLTSNVTLRSSRLWSSRNDMNSPTTNGGSAL
jgi:hypothetical protein